MASKDLTALSIANAPQQNTKPKNTSIAAYRDAKATGMSDASARKQARTTPVVSSAIAPSDLEATPVINVPTPATPIQAPAMMAEFETGTDEFTQKQEQARKEAEKTKGTTLEDYLTSIKSAQGLTSLTAAEYAKEGGVDSITPELNDINDKIRREQLSLRRAKEAILEKGGGLASGAAAEIGNLERESFAKQADMAVIQMAVQGRYDSAKEIADRAVSAKLEQQKNYNDALKFAYDEAKDIFTTAEQREFETLLGNRDRTLQEESDRMKQINDFALAVLQAGAPTSVAQQIMSGAKTLDEAIAMGGEYLRPKATGGGSPELKNFGTSENPIWKEYDPSTGSWVDVNGLVDTSSGAPLKKVTDKEIQDLNQAKIDTDSLVRIVDDMVTSIEQEGTKVFWGKEAGKRGSAKTNLLLAMKNLEKTGALDAGTINVLSETIPDNEFWATEAAQIAALNELKTIVTGKTNELVSSYRGTTAEIDPRTGRIYEQFRPKLELDEVAEIDSLFGASNTPQAQFNPGNYY